MTAAEFEKILERRLSLTKEVLAKKGKEYANADRLHNFRRAAAIEECSVQKALLGMLSKHLVSVLDMVDDPRFVTESMIDEKIGDTINYLILLEAVFKEQLELKN